MFEADRGGRSADWYLAQREGHPRAERRDLERAGARRDGALDLGSVARTGRYRAYALGAGLEHLARVASCRLHLAHRGGSTVVSAADPTIAGGALGRVALAPRRGDAGGGRGPVPAPPAGPPGYDERYSLWLDALVLEAVK